MRFITHIRQLVRFMQLPREQKRIVFYSEGGAYWVHLEELLTGLLRESDLPICYISSSKDDPGLRLEHERLQSFLIDEGWVRNWLFENIDTDVMIMTMPDLDQYQVKRSRHPVHYVYVQHSLVSLHMAYRKGAFDHFDTILCAGPYHMNEIRAMESHYRLPAKVLVEHAYSRLYKIMAEQRSRPTAVRDPASPIHVLIAPSWGPAGIIETVGSEVVGHLLAEGGFKVTLRPHPQTVRFAGDKIDAIVDEFGSNPLFSLEVNVAGQDSLQQSDIMISDWSGAALEYAFGLKKPVLFIDVPKKVNNPEYHELGLPPFEDWVRKEIGRILPVDKLTEITSTLTDIVRSKKISGNIENLCKTHIYDVTTSDKPIPYIRELASKNS